MTLYAVSSASRHSDVKEGLREAPVSARGGGTEAEWAGGTPQLTSQGGTVMSCFHLSQS